MNKKEEKEIKDLFHALKFGFMCKGAEKLLKRLNGSVGSQARLMFDGQVKAEIVVDLEKGDKVDNFIKTINDHDKRMKEKWIEEIVELIAELKIGDDACSTIRMKEHSRIQKEIINKHKN